MSRLSAVLVTAAAVLLLSAGTASAHWRGHHRDAAPPAGTIVDTAIAASGADGPDANPYDYDLLIAAAAATGLVPVLDDESATFTVFAPHDRAFERLVADLTGSWPGSEQATLDAILATFTLDQIKEVLLYHVVAGEELGVVDVLRSRTLTMADGGTVRPRGLNLRDETSALRDPRLVLSASGIRATNGVIHTIDRVLVPAL